MINLAHLSRYGRRLLGRPYPHGLSGWGFLLPSKDLRVGVHRQIWWYGRSRQFVLFWLIMEGWLGLRWHGFEAWRATWWAVRHYGPIVLRREGVSLAGQGWRILSLALRWGIPPADAYTFRLIQRPETALDYIYSMETGSHHRWRSRGLGSGHHSLALLQDKWQQTQVLSQQGVPMAPILALVAQGEQNNLLQWLDQEESLFCKTRSGNRGIGAFAVWREQNQIHGRTLAGHWLNNQAAVVTAWRELLTLDDALIQPRLKNHPLLTPLAEGNDAITVRFISQMQDGQLTALCALLQLPAGCYENTGRSRYVIQPVDCTSGRILPVPQEDMDSEQPHYIRVQKLLTEESTLPHWQTLVDNSFRAHTLFADIWAIAWDWVITPTGPLLLEGNSGWGPTNPQAYYGGLLNSASRA